MSVDFRRLRRAFTLRGFCAMLCVYRPSPFAGRKNFLRRAKLMRSLILTVAALALCVCALFAACSPQDGSAPVASSRATTAVGDDTQTKPAPATPAADQTRRISIEETQKAVADSAAIIIDVRDESSYKASHIKGAKNIPLSQFEQRMGELPKDKLIITYCA
jgi:hypothetical protein